MMAARIAAPNPPGSLLKVSRAIQRRRKDLGRNPRQTDPEHLAMIRECPCLVCRRWPVEAAHVRMSAPGKPNAGIGAKPSDEFALPLCYTHHAEQHGCGEREFYDRIGIDPLKLAAALYRVSPNVGKMREIVLAHHMVAVINLSGGGR